MRCAGTSPTTSPGAGRWPRSGSDRSRTGSCRPARLAAGGQGAAHLLDVLGLHPNSAEFYQRAGYSYDTLRNMESLVWGGDQLADVLNMMIEGITSRRLLLDLGYRPQRDEGTA